MSALPSHARVIVCGAGVIGSSVAYHLARMGAAWKDVLVLEQGQISGGTTWHAAGLIGKMRNTMTEVRLSDYASTLLPALEEETGQSTGFRKVGSITVARNDARLAVLTRNAARAQAFGIRAELISPKEAQAKFPHMQVDDIKGALWLPDDGTATSSDLCAAYVKGVRMHGGKIVEGVTVDRVLTQNNAVVGVRTECGQTISCEYFVNCGGLWARELGLRSAPPVHVPLHSAEHFYMVTMPIEGCTPHLPVLRDPDGYMYYREFSGGLMCGGFEPFGHVKPCFTDSIPKPFVFSLLPNDWDRHQWAIEEILLRVPIVAQTQIRQLLNGPESFTPDNQYILGEAPGLRRYFVAAGMNSSGIASSAGAGRALSEWIANGSPTMDLWPIDIRRFAPFSNTKKFVHDRMTETLGLHYAIPWPRRELETARGLRRSAVYQILKAAGAEFGSKMGWERANWFHPIPTNTSPPPSSSTTSTTTSSSPVASSTQPPRYSMGVEAERPSWFQPSCEEHRSCRTSAAVFDQSSFGKIRVNGPHAVAFMQRVCANNVDVPVGRMVYTGMLNERAGYESDFTVSRTGQNEYLIVTGSSQIVRDLNWLENNVQHEEKVTFTDDTTRWSVLGLMGPRSRDILQSLTKTSLANESFPFSTFQDIEVGLAPVRAARMTYVGELGWELYVPSEMAEYVLEEIITAGQTHGLRHGGYYAMESLRVEKGYRAWGADISPDDTPLEAGLAFAVDWSKPFLGRAALEKQRTEGVRKRLVSLTLSSDAATTNMMWGGEPILRNGTVVGYTSSACFGPSLGTGVALGYIKNGGELVSREHVLQGSYEVLLTGTKYPAAVSLRAPFDPTASRTRA